MAEGHPGAPPKRVRILLLGGTAEARHVSAELAARPDIDLIVSLKGLTQQPRAYAGQVRTGGFGGVKGLCAYLLTNGIAACIDATHPFAAQMAKNAGEACTRAACPLIRLVRPEWQPGAGDNWIRVPSIAAAADAIPIDSVVFVALGALGSQLFAERSRARMIVRTADPVQPRNRIPGTTYVTGLPDGNAPAEADLLRRYGVTHVAVRNSGGSAGRGKLEAARHLGLPVVMVERPQTGPGRVVSDVAAIRDWLRPIVGGEL
ncbi:MAG: cobalt-precorrin-6A reductase [Pseudomonadota bacterium]